MKGKTVWALSGVGMFLTSVAVYTVTPAGGFPGEAVASPEPAGDWDREWGHDDEDQDAEDDGDGSPDVGAGVTRFSAGDALRVEARLGHPRIGTEAGAETFLLLDVESAAEPTSVTRPRVHLALVLDRSGSMAGQRMKNAKAAAAIAVQRLREGDTVSVLAFDTGVERVVAPTQIDSLTRGEIVQAIDRIQLGGDTCISCGIDSALSDVAGSSGTVDQVLLLSDGEANRGMVTLADLQAMGVRARNQGSSITTVGVDLAYNEETLRALTLESNGRHHFVRNEADLGAVFEKEASILTGTVAADAVAIIDLEPGYELARVVDRPFERTGSQIRVPLGSFGKGESKSVLLAVRATTAALADSSRLASVEVRFRDAASAREELGRAEITIGRSSSPATSLAAEIETRLQRTDTADALRLANELFRKGDLLRARETIKREKERLEQTEGRAKSKAPPKQLAPLDADFKVQRRALDEADLAFEDATVPGEGAAPPSPAPKTNVANELPLRF